MTNSIDKVSDFDIDVEGLYNPYRIKINGGKNGPPENRYSQVMTDHRFLTWTMNLAFNKKMKVGQKMISWRFGKPGGRKATDEV